MYKALHASVGHYLPDYGQVTVHYSAFAFDEIVEIFASVAETVMCLSFTHDFHLQPSLKCIEMVGKTIFFKSGEAVQIVVMCKIQTLHQSLQQTNFPTISSKVNALLAVLQSCALGSVNGSNSDPQLKTARSAESACMIRVKQVWLAHNSLYVLNIV